MENKRLALEALSVKVWVDKETVTIEGAIPINPKGVKQSLRYEVPRALPVGIYYLMVVLCLLRLPPVFTHLDLYL